MRGKLEALRQTGNEIGGPRDSRIGCPWSGSRCFADNLLFAHRRLELTRCNVHAVSVRANLTVIHVSPTRPEGPPRQTGWGQAPQHHPLHDIPPSEGNFGRGVPQCSTENICPSRGTPETYGQGPHTKRKPAAGQHKRFAPEIPQSKGDTGWRHGRPCGPPARRH